MALLRACPSYPARPRDRIAAARDGGGRATGCPRPVSTGAMGGSMQKGRWLLGLWGGLVVWSLLGGGGGCTSAPVTSHESAGFQNFTSPQANPIVLSPDRAFVY